MGRTAGEAFSATARCPEGAGLYAGIHQRQHGLHRCMSKRFPFAVFYDVTKESQSGVEPPHSQGPVVIKNARI